MDSVELASVLHGKWRALRQEDIELDNANQVVRLYLEHIVGLSEEKVEKFLANDRVIYDEVGMFHSGMPLGDESKFWDEVTKLFPDLHTQEELDFLKVPKTGGGFFFVLTISKYSEYGQLLKVNIHAYK